MNYNNAVPKPLKFLVSDGKLIDEAGNVIAESETLKDLYTKWAPEVKKYLLSDGSVVDENNNLIIKNDYYKKMYGQADPKVAKYLHADGTVDENPGGGAGADLENNHQETIDVSTYTEPVEITPTAGKDGMKKATITLSNIPSGGDAEIALYAFEVVEGQRFGEATAGDALYLSERALGDGSLDGVPYNVWSSNNNIPYLEWHNFSDTENLSGNNIESYGTTIAIRNPDMDLLVKSSS